MLGQRQRSKRVNLREAYFILTSIDLPQPFDGHISLCHFCKYAEWYGDCYLSELDCHHGLEVVVERCYEVWEGGDCWGFRPKYSREVAVDIVGLYLTGYSPDFGKLERIGLGAERK